MTDQVSFLNYLHLHAIDASRAYLFDDSCPQLGGLHSPTANRPEDMLVSAAIDCPRS